MSNLTFFIEGTPVPQPRHRIVRTRSGKVGRYVTGPILDWTRTLDVALAENRPPKPYEGAVLVEMEFYLPGEWRHRRRKADLDNLAKPIMDRASVLGFWEDDDQVAVLAVEKRWAFGDDKPGVLVRINGLDAGSYAVA